jgi:hypothetical protein
MVSRAEEGVPETAPLNDVEKGHGRAPPNTGRTPARLGHTPSQRITVYVQQLTGAKHKVTIIHNQSSPVLVGELKRTINTRHGGPTPDGMKLLRNNVDGTPGDAFDEDDTQSLAGAGILDGATVHMTVQDEAAGKARRQAREEREALKAEAQTARNVAARYEERIAERRAENRRKRCLRAIFYISASAAITFLVLLVAYFIGGCGACENDATCNGMFGECVCSGNHTGTFCELRPDEIVDEDEAGGVPSWLVITCCVVAVAGVCLIGYGSVAETGDQLTDLLLFFLFLPAGGCAICVAMAVLGVAALVTSL